ncbi:FMN-binding negative transcriptional regulator [Stakelama sp. CBK3Z-3]|uniref:FMN-binding negative transcriptional regulator n=1 Tax=Stakelama flava TaxID=2860338 RepID=A0ABS6XK25_9SPHN|nr:FMN-binding negative transcriptional regulator [Stakelama flava]MBW4330554.1 FMN-binding negative transcriptional regulator [Stakelama flava]
MKIFDDFSNDDARDLITAYPLGWVVAPGHGVDAASLLPLLGEYDSDGRLVRLIGHMSRRNALYDALAPEGTALILFTGPHAYISPEHARRRDWGPTWNYAQLRVEARLVFTPEATGAAVDRIVAHMESGRKTPWSKEEIAHRYHGMLKAIIGFRAEVTAMAGRFKLGQDEADPVLANILDTLDDPALVQWMRRFNPGRADETE